MCGKTNDDGSFTTQGLYGICGSGMNDDCKVNGNKYTGSQTCCDNSDIKVSSQESCGWRYGNYGDMVSCPSGYIAAGFCGSSNNPECDSGAQNSFTGVMCCPFTDVRS